MRLPRPLLALLAAAGSLLAIPGPCAPPPPSPLAKAPIAKIDLDAKQLVLDTKEGPCVFTFNNRTYFFRGKQKISAEELHLGEVVALRFTTSPQGERLIQRLKAPPAAPPAASTDAPLPPAQ